MKSLTLTEKIIDKMLKENTGRSILDSGDFYGRHYERNANRTFENEESSGLSFRFGYLEYSKNLYHFLINHLQYNVRLTNSLISFCDKTDEDGYTPYDKLIELWLKEKSKHFKISDGLYGESDKPISDYTYNNENSLSQDFIYTIFGLDGDSHVIIQIHNGCDARGGFTEPKTFDFDQGSDTFLIDIHDGYIYCESNKNHNWFTDDSHHWYYDGMSPSEYELESMAIQSLEDFKASEEYQKALAKVVIIPNNQMGSIEGYNPSIINPVKYPDNVILTDDNDNGLCPVCHGGILLPG